MKIIIIGVTAIIGLVGGAVSMVGNEAPEESIQVEYLDLRDSGGEVQYINFTEPMKITGRIQHIIFTPDEAAEVLGNVK